MIWFLFLGAGTARADFGIKPGSLELGLSTLEAGAHPDVTTAFEMNLDSENNPEGHLKSTEVELPPGLVGNAGATPKCTMAEVIGDPFGGGICPLSTAVGKAEVTIFFPNSGFFTLTALIHNIEPYRDEPAAMAALAYFPIRIDTHVRSDGDYGVTASVRNANEGAPVTAVKMTFWGVPADHNGPPRPGDEEFTDGWGRIVGGPGSGQRLPFMTNPTACGEDLTGSFTLAPWEAPADFSTYEVPVGQISGCEKLSLEPSIDVRPTNHRAGAPAGYSVQLDVPQNQDPDGLATAHVEDAKITMPEGVTLSPAVANGLSGCADAQIGLHDQTSSQCPPSSRVGTATIQSPLLPGPLQGFVYVGQPRPGNPYRVFFSFEGYGVRVKLEGRVDLDPTTGQITATFLDNPQLPFSQLEVRFNDGPNAPLVNAPTCGVQTVQADLKAYGGQDARTTDSFLIDIGCGDAGFSPGFNAGLVDATAGGSSAFLMRITREDGEENLSRIATTLPKGLLAKLAGVPLCGEAEATAGSCPSASQIGRVVVGAGAGSNPLYVPQPGKAQTGLYLAGPYRNAPYSLVATVPAQAGPFDLGTVVVRNALRIDPATAQVTAVSDPFPQILAGVPIDYRDVRVIVDREDFVQAPTACNATSVDGSVSSIRGQIAKVSDRFRVVDCARLGFKPSLSLRLSGPTHRSAHPRLRAVLKARKDDANIRKAVVTLPRTEFLENAHIRTICTRVRYAADNCPQDSIYGYAKAFTPLLDKPLQGPVYLRSSNHPLPDFVASLDGQIHVDLAGRIDSVNQRLRTTFWAVPDAPVSKFVLTMQGAKKGLLVNNTELCKAKPRARAEFTGQNGKVRRGEPLVKTSCGKGKR
ncbi:MAG TPA: hypothetical protein VGW80_09315 [Solirubrobacterales bacterium]|nr:hypothetical protein [Solirubrobacterales bacterium]